MSKVYQPSYDNIYYRDSRDKRKLFVGDHVVITQGRFEGCEGEVSYLFNYGLSAAVSPTHAWPGRDLQSPSESLYYVGTHKLGLVLEVKR